MEKIHREGLQFRTRVAMFGDVQDPSLKMFDQEMNIENIRLLEVKHSTISKNIQKRKTI